MRISIEGYESRALDYVDFAWVDKLAEGRPGGSGGSDSESPDEI